MKLDELSPNVGMDADNPRGGVNLHFDLCAVDMTQLTSEWTLAGWKLRFVFLPPHQTLELGHASHYLKVITGSLVDPWRECFPEDFTVRTTRLEGNLVSSGDDGLFCALLSEGEHLPENIHSMSDCSFTGPMDQQLVWKSFRDRFGAFTDYFDQLDNHMADGFHLLDSNKTEIAYVNFWTCGKDGDVSTHNHAQDPSPLGPAFAEVHLVLNNGTGTAGMYETPGPDADQRKLHVMARGDEHGPFFEHRNGKPVLLDNGAVKYPWHGWQSGSDDRERQSYDLVAAFEINPSCVSIPSDELH